MNTPRHALHSLADPDDAEILRRFFKTGPGEYAEGDVFIGVRVPAIRKLVRRYADLPWSELRGLVTSRVHEERMLGLLILVRRFQRTEAVARKRIYTFYLKHTRHVNNWDLVDLTAEHIVGGYLLDKPRDVLYELALSDDLWERRISILSTFHFIRRGSFADTLKLAEILRDDKHDLIHKAVGWMLREVGNRDRAAEERFLRRHYRRMPRTMLRYAIEKFPEKKRQDYLKGTI